MLAIMPTRYEQLENTLKGFRRSGFYLVQWREGHFGPSAISDDKGLYYFVRAHSGMSIFLCISVMVCFKCMGWCQTKNYIILSIFSFFVDAFYSCDDLEQTKGCFFNLKCFGLQGNFQSACFLAQRL